MQPHSSVLAPGSPEACEAAEAPLRGTEGTAKAELQELQRQRAHLCLAAEHDNQLSASL